MTVAETTIHQRIIFFKRIDGISLWRASHVDVSSWFNVFARDLLGRDRDEYI